MINHHLNTNYVDEINIHSIVSMNEGRYSL